DINSSDQDGNTPLSLAVKYKHLDIIRVLLAHPSINPNSQNRVGETAFHIASRHGYVSCLQILLTSKGDPDLRSHNGNTPLCVASSKGHSDIVQLLLALPVWKVNCVVQNSKGKTPLSCAVTGGHKRVVKALLQHEI
ncbi:ankyrin repeat-containing domain protein, partial [Kalaharituber pfeilii]